jgi:class 3 adenylate cyclase
MTTTRHLAAIPAADVAGYSRLMRADEEGTLATQVGLRVALELARPVKALPIHASAGHSATAAFTFADRCPHWR